MNPLVSTVHGKEKRWRQEFSTLRNICLCTGLNESLKWGQACYDLSGSNVVLIHGFKEYCALLFMKGALLQDCARVLIQQTKNVQAQRQIRFRSCEEVTRLTPVIRAYILEAIQIEQSGAKVPMKTLAQFETPEEFRQRLDEGPELARAFAALTSGRQKAYVLHFSSAKQSATRTARVEKNIPRILNGLGLDD
jgi:uncharacterized protein YdeI (YjbR/CyaY-like superfamily)